MFNFDLNDDNFVIFMMKCYNSPNCIMSEFEEDIKRIKYIKRLLNKYIETKDLKEQLILNHIIVLSNVFGSENIAKILFFKISSEYHYIIKTFLTYLNLMPRHIYGINGKTIHSADISIDLEVTRKLQLLGKRTND